MSIVFKNTQKKQLSIYKCTIFSVIEVYYSFVTNDLFPIKVHARNKTSMTFFPSKRKKMHRDNSILPCV